MAITGYFLDQNQEYREVLLGFRPLEGIYSRENCKVATPLASTKVYGNLVIEQTTSRQVYNYKDTKVDSMGVKVYREIQVQYSIRLNV